ncbi:MAG: adenylate/guanylate cyclase domain-containing protein [Candidatus Riflebacteria bacterium]|nr:adenylate/guanylate cyclase domain-containing protein [Candidatus Riflebacteria bacterium]
MHFTRKDFFSSPDSRSLVTRAFLMVALVIFPLFIAYLTLSKAINEKTDSEIDKLKYDLLNQAIFVSKLAKPQYQTKLMLTEALKKGLLKHSDKEIGTFFDVIDKKFPGTFKWVVFDSIGKVRSIPSPRCLAGKKNWEGLLKSYFDLFGINLDKPGQLESRFDPEVQAAFKFFQTAFGSSIKSNSTFKGFEQVLEITFYGKAAWLTWDLDIKKYGPSGNPKETNGGVILLVYPEKLSSDFGPRQAILSRKHHDKNLAYPMMMMKIGDPKSAFLDPELPRKEKFALLAYKSFSKRNDYFLGFFDWIGATVPSYESENPERMIVFANIGSLIKERNGRLSILSNVLLGLFILRFLLVWLFKPLSGLVNSLRPKILGFFMIAVFLPVVSLLGFGYVWIAREDRLYRERLIDTMRKGIEGLDLRFRDAPKIIEKDVFSHLNKSLEKASSNIGSVVGALEREAQEGRLTYYFLSDTNGKLVKTNCMILDAFIKKMIEENLKKNLEFERGVELNRTLGDKAFSEEMESYLGKTGKPRMTSAAGSLVYFCYRNLHFYFMGMPVKIGSDLVSLIVQLDASLVEKFFVAEEFVQNSTKLHSEDFAPPILGFYGRLKGSKQYPPGAEEWTVLTKAIEQSYELRSKISGEVEIEGERFLYFISPLPSMPLQSYMPVYLSSLKQIETRVSGFQKLLLAVALVVFLVALLLGLFLAGNLLDPITRIDGAIKLIGEGNLNVRLPEGPEDEIGRLGTNINAMVQGLKERKILTKYVSENVLEAIGQNTGLDLRPGELTDATVLFCDIRGFTKLSEQHPPGEIFEMLNGLIGGVFPIIQQNIGRTDKFIGDAIMALFFGLENGKHAQRAVRAALQTVEFVSSFNKTRIAEGRFPIKIGIGLNTGEVMRGDIGCEGRRDLTVIGDTVNLASRLESYSVEAQTTGIVISEAVAKEAAEIVEIKEIGQRQVKGKALPVKMFEVLSLSNKS